VFALIFGLIPALVLTRVSLSENLKGATSNAVAGAHSRQFRNILVAIQLALGVVLLVGFGLLWRSLLNVESSPIGYDAQNVLTVSTRFPAIGYTAPLDRVRLMKQAANKLRAMPGVQSVGMVDSLPMQGAENAHIIIDVSAGPVDDEIWFVSVSPTTFQP
jgi:putative ABC transport system permease protein